MLPIHVHIVKAGQSLIEEVVLAQTLPSALFCSTCGVGIVKVIILIKDVGDEYCRLYSRDM